MSKDKMKRGPYKRWVLQDDADNVKVPKTTRWRLKKQTVSTRAFYNNTLPI